MFDDHRALDLKVEFPEEGKEGIVSDERKARAQSRHQAPRASHQRGKIAP
jgi:hypothetical protein